MSAVATPVLCGSCRKPRDERGRCWACSTWLCGCGRASDSALRSMCDRCGRSEERPVTATTVYGQPAVAVEQPSGDVVAYLVRAVESLGHEWRAWVVTSPKGDPYRVSELLDGRVVCECPAWRHNRHGAGRWCTANGKPVCKHGLAVWYHVIRPVQGKADVA